MPVANPYIGLPPRAFWRTGVAEESPFDVKDIYRRKFEIGADDKIATAGSCFAQHIGRVLKRSGYSVLDFEPPPPWLPADLHLQYGYSTYSARYGNIYTVAQLAQLAAECVGAFSPTETAWARGDRFVDPFRPSIEPEGFSSADEVSLARRFHLQQVRALFRTMDVFVFTLGLTETWLHAPSGAFLPSPPGVLGGTFDDQTYRFVNLKYGEVQAHFARFLEALSRIREGRRLKIILTVSPVPLTATASGDHVLPATSYSKSVLRAVAGDLAATHDLIDYFPSYEIITNPAAHATFFDSNLRTVRPAGVQAVMDTFFAAHRPLRDAAGSPSQTTTREASASNADVQCEEALLEAFA